MGYLIDINVISELQKGRRCDENVQAWFDSVPENEIFLSVLVIGEIRLGIERLRRRDLPQAQILEQRLISLQTKMAAAFSLPPMPSPTAGASSMQAILCR